mgnify:CR=1 FL=1
MSEKNTDHFMQSHYQYIFNAMYHTEANNEYFNSKIPDGWDIIDNAFIIIENKKLNKQKKEGRDQLFSYYDNLPDNVKSTYIIYLILGLGNTEKTFKTIIYDNNKTELDITLEDIKKQINKQPTFDKNEIHNLNQYLYDNSITLSKSQKTLFVAAILICLKIDKDILSDYEEGTNNYLIADKMISVIDNYYEDKTFSNMFSFIKKSIHNRHIYHIFNLLTVDIKKYGKDILNEFYSEFCAWDRNNDALLGIVLTPDDIVDLMITKSFDYYYQFNNNKDIKLIDFCTGTGSFLIKGSKYTNLLYGCECGDERYSLAKCNFILNNLDYSNLKYESCFNVNYHSNYFDVSIINPPFSNRCQDEYNNNDIVGWRNYDQEQKFIMYQVELLRENGIGCCIVPRSNFNNNIKCTNEFKQVLLNNVQVLEIINCNSKVFVPNASVECAILVYRKIKINDYQTKIIDYSDDGYKIKKGVRYYDHQPITKKQLRTLKYDDDWNYQNELITIDNDDLVKLIENYNNNYQYAYNNLLINKKEKKQIEVKYCKYLLSDIIEPLKYKTYTYDKCSDGDIPFFVASQLNIPKGYKDVVSVDCDKLGLDNVLCINKSGEGVIGYCHIRSGRFGCNGIVGCYKMKIKLSIPNLAILQHQLINKFNHHFVSLSLNDIRTTEVFLIKNEIKYDDIIKIAPLTYGEIKEWKEIKISDYFENVKVKPLKISECREGDYPLISSCSGNNGIGKFINTYSIEGEFISVARNGSVGSSFYQNGQISITTDIILLKPLKDINLHLMAMLLNYYLPSKYSYNNKLTINKLMNEIIKIPIFE